MASSYYQKCPRCKGNKMYVDRTEYKNGNMEDKIICVKCSKVIEKREYHGFGFENNADFYY